MPRAVMSRDHCTSCASCNLRSTTQGLAFTLGRGRVVVLGEAAMLTAQVAGPKAFKMGMNAPGNDDRQFALNVLR